MYNKHSQLSKNTNSTKLVTDKILEQTLHQRQTDGKETQEQMFNVISHQENANENHKEIPVHTH